MERDLFSRASDFLSEHFRDRLTNADKLSLQHWMASQLEAERKGWKHSLQRSLQEVRVFQIICKNDSFGRFSASPSRGYSFMRREFRNFSAYRMLAKGNHARNPDFNIRAPDYYNDIEAKNWFSSHVEFLGKLLNKTCKIITRHWHLVFQASRYKFAPYNFVAWKCRRFSNLNVVQTRVNYWCISIVKIKKYMINTLYQLINLQVM